MICLRIVSRCFSYWRAYGFDGDGDARARSYWLH